MINLKKKELNFQGLQKFVLEKMAMVQKVAVYDTERIHETTMMPVVPAITSVSVVTLKRNSLVPNTTVKSAPIAPASLSDLIAELTKQMSHLTLQVEAIANSHSDGKDSVAYRK